MIENEMDEQQKDVVRRMSEHNQRFLTPISKVITHDHGELLGSGAFIEIEGEKLIITNEHVGRKMAKRSLAHQFNGSDSVVRVASFCADKYPVDVAIAPISETVWSVCEHSAECISMDKFAESHNPVSGELLYFSGYPDERSAFCFGTLFTVGIPYATQEIDFPPTAEHDPLVHFALPYPYERDLAVSVDGATRGLPSPPGMSGSLVWNTRYAECVQKGEVWSPEKARVTGVVCRWFPDEECLLATRVEYMSHKEMAQALREEH